MLFRRAERVAARGESLIGGAPDTPALVKSEFEKEQLRKLRTRCERAANDARTYLTAALWKNDQVLKTDLQMIKLFSEDVRKNIDVVALSRMEVVTGAVERVEAKVAEAKKSKVA